MFDPMTGKPIPEPGEGKKKKKKDGYRFDPMTGKPLTEDAEKQAGQEKKVELKKEKPSKKEVTESRESESKEKSSGEKAAAGERAVSGTRSEIRRWIPAAVIGLVIFFGVILLFRACSGVRGKTDYSFFLYRSMDENETLMGAMLAGGTPGALFPQAEPQGGLYPEALSGDGNYLYLLERQGEGKGTLWGVNLKDKQRGRTELGREVLYAIPGDQAVYSYTSDGAVYRSTTDGKRERILREVQGFLISHDLTHILFWDKDRVYLQDLPMEEERVRLMPKWDELFYYSPDFSRFVYGQGGRLYLWSAGKKEETISSQLKECWCVSQDDTGAKVIFTEYGTGDGAATSLYLYEEKDDKVTPILENEFINGHTAPLKTELNTPKGEGGVLRSKAAATALVYTFDVYNERLKETTHYYGEGTRYGRILDEDTSILSMQMDASNGKKYALVYDTQKDIRETGRIVELTMNKKGEASAAQIYDAEEILLADGGKLFYYVPAREGSELYMNGKSLTDGVLKGEALYFGSGRLAYLAEQTGEEGCEVYYYKGAGDTPVCLDKNVSELLGYRFSGVQ